MSASFSVFLTFEGNCTEVLDFYAKVFKTAGSRTLYGEAPDGVVPGFENKIMYADMLIGGVNVMFSDVPPDFEHIAGNNFVLTYTSNNHDEVRRVFEAISEGGIVNHNLEKTFFSELYSMVTDKFGISWNIMA